MSGLPKQAVAGVVPPEVGEATIMEATPSIGATAVGRALSPLFSLRFPFGLLFGMLTLIVILPLFFLNLLRRYTLTTLRVRDRNTLSRKVHHEVGLAELEDVRLVERPGQGYYRAGDLELLAGGQVALTLPGVPNPKAFRHNIIAARDALVRVGACRQAQEADSTPSN